MHIQYLVLEFENQREGSNATVRSMVMDEERLRPGYWLGSVIWVSFSALMLLVGWQERLRSAQSHKPVPLTSAGSFLAQVEEETQDMLG